MSEVIRPTFGNQLTMVHSSSDPCKHSHMLVDAAKRTLECKNCKAVLDPFEVHLQYAHRERTWRGWDQERRAAEKRIEELKAEERKIKARTKAASRKDAQAAVAEERHKSFRKRAEIVGHLREMADLCRRIESIALSADERVTRDEAGKPTIELFRDRLDDCRGE